MGRLMPLYAGIETLRAEGESVQWGGARLGPPSVSEEKGEGTRGFNTPNGRAQMKVIEVPTVVVPEGKFFLASRRGKQFNSITYGQKDPILGVRSRGDVLFAAKDLDKLGLRDGDAITLRSETGQMRARARTGPCRAGHLQAYWPECNVLIGRKYDPQSGEPDYNAIVSVEPAKPSLPLVSS